MSAQPSAFTFSGRDGTSVAAYRWDDVAAPRAIVQVTHGMGEHAQRYGPLAAALNGAGLIVYAQDHRGHGATALSAEQFGQFGSGGWAALVDDIDVLRTTATGENPGLPVVLLGHSMGSFAVQQYLLDHSVDVAAAVLTGTSTLDLLETGLNLDEPLELAAFNAPFAPARTDFDWLSRDDAQVDAYLDDPWCGFGLDLPGGKAMFAGARPLADPARMARVRADLPLYVAVGEQDPVGADVALVHALVDRYRQAGLSVTLRTYPGARHEVFNETNRDEVVADLLGWLDGALSAASG